MSNRSEISGAAAGVHHLALPLDLNDPVVENEVADAIRRLAPHGEYVPLSRRYPWRFTDPVAVSDEVTMVDAVVEALRGSADVHEAERIPHLVAPLRALAEALERGALVPGPPPGRCGAPGFRLVIMGVPHDPICVCELRAGHAGQHEGHYWPPVPEGEIAVPEVAYWDEPDLTPVRRLSDAELQDRLRQLHDELNRRHASTP